MRMVRKQLRFEKRYPSSHLLQRLSHSLTDMNSRQMDMSLGQLEQDATVDHYLRYRQRVLRTCIRRWYKYDLYKDSIEEYNLSCAVKRTEKLRAEYQIGPVHRLPSCEHTRTHYGSPRPPMRIGSMPEGPPSGSPEAVTSSDALVLVTDAKIILQPTDRSDPLIIPHDSLTAANVIWHPTTDDPDEYQTGDLCLYDAAEDIEYVIGPIRHREDLLIYQIEMAHARFHNVLGALRADYAQEIIDIQRNKLRLNLLHPVAQTGSICHSTRDRGRF